MKPPIRVLLPLVAAVLLASACQQQATDAAAMAEFDLAGSQWRVEDIAGAGVVDGSHTTIGFGADAQVAGDSGCNRYAGSYQREGQALSFGPLAGTRRACVPALMDQETRFYAAMGQVARWEVAGTGQLLLLDAAGTAVIRATPASDGT